jgi:hypothetical protein
MDDNSQERFVLEPQPGMLLAESQRVSNDMYVHQAATDGDSFSINREILDFS